MQKRLHGERCQTFPGRVHPRAWQRQKILKLRIGTAIQLRSGLKAGEPPPRIIRDAGAFATVGGELSVTNLGILAPWP